jgi:hypothetical protein
MAFKLPMSLLVSSALVGFATISVPPAEAGNYASCKALGEITNGKSCICIQSDHRKKKDQVGGGFQENCAGVRVANFNVPSVADSPQGMVTMMTMTMTQVVWEIRGMPSRSGMPVKVRQVALRTPK